MVIFVLGPTTSLQLTLGSTLLLLSSYLKSNPSKHYGILKKIMKPYVIPSKFHHLLQLSGLPYQRLFCSVIFGALQSSESAKVEFLEKDRGEIGNTAGEFQNQQWYLYFL